MFKNEPLWAVYAVLKQHYPHLAGGKTNKAFKLNLKKNIFTAALLYYYKLLSVASYTPTNYLCQMSAESDKTDHKLEAFY